MILKFYRNSIAFNNFMKLFDTCMMENICAMNIYIYLLNIYKFWYVCVHEFLYFLK
jgi:hypothetical protein